MKLIFKKLLLLILLLTFVSFLFMINCTGGEETVDEGDGGNNEEDDDDEIRPDPNEGPIFSYNPKDGEKYLSDDSVKRKVALGDEPVTNPMLLGTDDEGSFLMYSQSQKEVVRFPSDASLGIAIIEDDLLETSEGEIIAGHINGTNIVLLQETGENEYKFRFFDKSGNDYPKKDFTISNILDILTNQELDIEDKYIFIVQNVFIMENGNVAITINETSSDNSHIAVDRPQFIIFNTNKEVENVITVIPPNWTGYGPDYWTESEVPVFHMDTAIYGNSAYILWGSGYSLNSTLGYIYQKVSLRASGAGTYATRVLKSGQDKENRATDSLPDDNNYASRGIWVDGGNVYIRLQIEDGTNIIDVYNSRDDYRQKYVLRNITGLGESSLVGPNNFVVDDDFVYWGSDEGLKLIDLSTATDNSPES